MRIWTVHPRFLDTKGLVACWRETLLAQKVLKGLTRGYKNHSQLIRFKATTDPLEAIGTYLSGVWYESKNRDYNFNQSKIYKVNISLPKMVVTTGQLQYEWDHLQRKLFERDKAKYKSNLIILNTRYRGKLDKYFLHPMFTLKNGDIEKWEII